MLHVGGAIECICNAADAGSGAMCWLLVQGPLRGMLALHETAMVAALGDCECTF